jgi:hypothetical protein
MFVWGPWVVRFFCFYEEPLVSFSSATKNKKTKQKLEFVFVSISNMKFRTRNSIVMVAELHTSIELGNPTILLSKTPHINRTGKSQLSWFQFHTHHTLNWKSQLSWFQFHTHHTLNWEIPIVMVSVPHTSYLELGNPNCLGFSSTHE